MNIESIELPGPKAGESLTVHQALSRRRTSRTLDAEKLSRQLLGDLLWSACGANRDSGPFGAPGITAASASNAQEIEVYALLAEGAYLYEAGGHRLVPIAEGDLRKLAVGRAQAPLGSEAPVRLVYVVDMDKLAAAPFQEPGLKDPEVQKSYYFVDTGIIAANVALFAASRGLVAWFHNCDKPGLAAALALKGDKRVLFGQTVGYEAKSAE